MNNPGSPLAVSWRSFRANEATWEQEDKFSRFELPVSFELPELSRFVRMTLLKSKTLPFINRPVDDQLISQGGNPTCFIASCSWLPCCC